MSARLRLRVNEKSVLKKIFGPTIDKIKGTGSDCRMGSIMICTPRQATFRR